MHDNSKSLTQSDQKTESKTALVLSGGFIKAASWHIGVGLALEELGFKIGISKTETKEDIEPKTISTFVGSSAGALISACYASGIKPMDLVEAQISKEKNTAIPPIKYLDVLKLNGFLPKNSLSNSSIFPNPFGKLYKQLVSSSGFFNTLGLKSYLEKNILADNSFENLSNDLFVVATQLDHSRKCIFSKYKYPNPRHDMTANYYQGISISDAVAASMSVPPIYAPHLIKNPHTNEDNYYIDGEIRETLSTHAAIDNGCEIIISSWTHTPYHYKREIGSLTRYGIPAICIQAIHLMIQKKIISSRASQATSREIIDTVSTYFKENKIDEIHRKKILTILEIKLNYNKNVQLIDIYPDNKNSEMFFFNPFSLQKDTTAAIVKMGYKKTLDVFSKL